MGDNDTKPSVSETEPLARYREQRFDGKRFFELYPGRIRIVGSLQFNSEFDTVVSLSSLDPQPTRLKIRHKSFWGGLWVLIIAVVVDTLLVGNFQFAPESFSVGLIGCIGMSGLVLMIATLRKAEFVAFNNHGGLRVLDVARSGPDARDFDSFVEQLTAEIARAAAPK